MWWSTESKLKTKIPATFNFLPSWWFREYGIAFGERMFADPEYRAWASREMNRLAFDRFGDIGLGESDPELIYINGHLSNATMPAAFGCRVLFSDDKYPANLPLERQQLEDIKIPADITCVYPFSEIIRQAKQVSIKADVELKASWPTMGIQNIALQIAGSEFLADYYADPAFATKLLKSSEELMLMSMSFFCSDGLKPEFFCNQNCSVPLVGPKTYEQFLLPFEMRLYRAASQHHLGYYIHHCGVFDDYADLYRHLENVSLLDVGFKSDLRLVLDTFPEANVVHIFDTYLLRDSTPGDVRDKVGTLLDIAGSDVNRLRLCIADIEHGTNDDNIRSIIAELLETE